MIALSGVRSSWLRFDRKSRFAWSASSACSFRRLQLRLALLQMGDVDIGRQRPAVSGPGFLDPDPAAVGEAMLEAAGRLAVHGQAMPHPLLRVGYGFDILAAPGG